MFQRLQTRLTVLYAAMFGVVLLGVCGFVYAGVSSQARRVVETNLASTGAVFDKLWQVRVDRLQSGAEVLARDFGFRAALASHDAPTIASAIDNLRERLHLDVAFATDPDGRALSGATAAIAAPVGATLARTGEARGVMFAGGQAYEVVSVPIYAPQLQGWIVFAVRLDAVQMRSLAQLSSIPLTAGVVHETRGAWRGEGMREGELAKLLRHPDRPGLLVTARGRDFALVRKLPTPDGADAAALLLRYPQAEALRPYRQLLGIVAALGFGGMMLVAFGSWMLASSVTRPIAELAKAAGGLRQGKIVHVDVRGRDEIGALADGFNAMVDAVSERELRIRQAALADSETRLPNRLALERRLRARAEGLGEGRTLVAAAFGVHQFARMRGVIGYDLAAELMKSLGARLIALQPGWVLARISSDTLGVLFDAAEPDDAADQVEAARQVLEAAVPVGGHLIDVRVATGLGFGATPHLIRDAEIALDVARQKGVHSARFDPVARKRAAASLGLMPELRRAIADDALTLAHQPKWNVRTGDVTSVESLIRWTHPRRGAIRPDAFIGLAEETGDIRALTDWVVTRAVAEQAELADADRSIAVSVNLSGRLVGDPGYTRWLLDALSKARAPMCLEITETAIIGNPEAALRTFEQLSEAGVSISIDDYGSGLSSLAYLKQIAAHELKLDRSLVVDVGRSSRDALLIKSTVDLAHGLGMKVVAEGVETEEVMALLGVLGCDCIQGWHVARPMPLEALQSYLAERSSLVVEPPPRRVAAPPRPA